MLTSPVLAYRCSVCERCFIAVDAPAEGDLRCACGAPLTPRSLPLGLYELRLPLPPLEKAPVAAAEPEPAREEHEHDLGYGASHGYDATHGGPSGPGDAPARES